MDTRGGEVGGHSGILPSHTITLPPPKVLVWGDVG